MLVYGEKSSDIVNKKLNKKEVGRFLEHLGLFTLQDLYEDLYNEDPGDGTQGDYIFWIDKKMKAMSDLKSLVDKLKYGSTLRDYIAKVEGYYVELRKQQTVEWILWYCTA